MKRKMYEICSKLIKVNNKDTRRTLLTLFWCFFCFFLFCFFFLRGKGGGGAEGVQLLTSDREMFAGKELLLNFTHG